MLERQNVAALVPRIIAIWRIFSAARLCVRTCARAARRLHFFLYIVAAAAADAAARNL